jgi:hypothetical protein
MRKKKKKKKNGTTDAAPTLLFVSTLDKARSWRKGQSIHSGSLARYLSCLGLLMSLGRFRPLINVIVGVDSC